MNLLVLVGNNLLEPFATVKDQDVTFDANLSFADHILKTVSSCMSSLAQVNRVNYVFDRQSLITIINPLALSKLFYCSEGEVVGAVIVVVIAAM